MLPDAATLLLVMTAALALNVTPGPDMHPKVALFFLAFLPQFVDPERGPVALQMMALGVLFNVQRTLVNILVAILASGASAWSRRRFGESPLMRRVTGLMFIGLGVRLALMERR